MAGRERLVVTMTPLGRDCLLTLSGSLDGDSAIALESQFDQLAGGEFDQVLLDVNGLRRLDDAGASVLGRLGQLLSDRGTTVQLGGCRPTR
jgi:anti-anti-sigma regulatory factor